MQISAHRSLPTIPGLVSRLRLPPLAIRLRLVLAGVLVFGCSVTPMAVAQQPSAPGMPNAPGAPASDVSNIPRPITDTMERVGLRDARKNAEGEQKPAAINETCFLPPLTLLHSLTVATTALAIPAKARKEYLEACGALKEKKIESAEMHLRKAVQKYPSYSAAWVTLGQMLAVQNRGEEAHKACAQSSTADPNFMPAYLCLADLAAREKAWGDVLILSNRALQLNPIANPIAYEYNAAANLRINKLDEAERSALLALANDKNNGEPRVHFVLAQIYEAKGNRANEITQLREYLKYAKDPDDVAAAKQYLSLLEQSGVTAANSTGQKERELPQSLPALPARDDRRTEAASNSGPPAENLSPLTPGGDVLRACRLDEVLPQVERRVEEFVENLQRFTATESLVMESFNGTGHISRTDRLQYDYVVSIQRSIPGMLQVNELQSSRSSSQGAERELVTSGLPALVLIFHPYYVGDFSMECEGLTSLNGKPAWLIHFRQRENKPGRIRTYSVGTNGRAYQLNLKGRAWFTAGNYQVLKLETDLVNPIPDIQLALDHISAEYGPVHFRSRGIDLWLPQSAELICERKGKRRHEQITFSDYFLFAVDNKQESASPRARECRPGIDTRDASEIVVCPNKLFGSPIIKY